MPVNKSSGQMNDFCDTWSPFGGLCPYQCKFCYVENKIAPWLNRMAEGSGRVPKYIGEPYLVIKELDTVLRSDKMIGVQLLGDMWHPDIASMDISRVLEVCRKHEGKNQGYWFPTKNPARFNEFLDEIPKNSVLGVSLESDIDHLVTRAPAPRDRFEAFKRTQWDRKMVSIEPILEFRGLEFLRMIRSLAPEFVVIGADSIQAFPLDEPVQAKLIHFIQELKLFTKVIEKPNLDRLKDISNVTAKPKVGMIRWLK